MRKGCDVKNCQIILCYIVILLLFPSILKAEILVVGNATAQPGETVTLPITVDHPGDIVGAAFTLTYNSQYLTLIDVQSNFFDTFANQWSSIVPQPNPMPPTQISVGGINYSQPLLYSQINSGTMIAAARVQAGATVTTLFQIQFRVDSTIPGDIYPVSIVQSSIKNTAAGYYIEGELIPLLLGRKNGESVYLNSSVVNGNIHINRVAADSDGDGINDAWELLHFGNLTTANIVTDFDMDGYTDLQEFLNGQNNETDPDGNAYDPNQHNAPNGTGYNNNDTGYNNPSKNFWILMMPVLTIPQR